MPTLAKRNFTGGELDPALHARADLVKYQTGCARVKNFFIKSQGGLVSRPGSEFVQELTDSTKKARLIPFEFNTEQAYSLIFSDQRMRVVKDGGLVLNAQNAVSGIIPTPITTFQVPGHNLQPGDQSYFIGMPELPNVNNRLFTVESVSGDSFVVEGIAAFDVVGYAGNGFVSSVFEITTPYLEAELPLLKYEQSADVLTLVHPNHPDNDLSRLADDNWTLAANNYSPTISPPANVTLIAGGNGGGEHARIYSYVVTAVRENGEESLASSASSLSTATLSESHYINISWPAVADAERYQIYKAESEVSNIFGWIGESKTLSFRDYNIQPDVSDTPKENRVLFTEAGKYPGAMTYYQQRRVFARSDDERQTIFATQSGNFKSQRRSRPTKDDDAFEATIASRTVNEIRHMIDIDSLIVLTSGAELLVSEGSEGVLTPATVGFRAQSYNGSSHVRPLVVGKQALYVEDGGRKVRDIGYNGPTGRAGGYGGDDLTIMSDHLFESREIVDWAYAKRPYGIVWVVLDDGSLLSLTYKREHDVWGWARHESQGEYESVCAIPEGREDAVYFIIKRTINGQVHRYIERLRSRQWTTSEDAFCVDSGKSYDGAPASEFSGLSHLEGQEVVALADGNVSRGLTVENGRVDLGYEASKVHIGLPYECLLETLDIDPLETSVRGRPLTVSELVIKLYRSRGGFAGPDENSLLELLPREFSDEYGAIPLRTEDVRVNLHSDWTDNGRVVIKQIDPLPMEILAVVPDVQD